ncbi:MAG: hypothetical protein KKH51_05160 [Actinobacteria bacterium]|nr:hypothetical protein [Actinomycetota bacterium]
MTSTNRLWVIGSVTVMIIAILAGWFLGAQPFIAAAAAHDTERAGIQAQNQAKLAEIASLTEENKNLSTIEAQYKDLQKSIPSSSNTAAFIQGLDGLAASTGVQVTGITVSDTVAYTVPASAVPAPTPTDGATPDPAATAVPSAPAAGYVPATSPLITPDNFVSIKVGVDMTGSYESVLTFVKGLQSGARLVLVTGFTSNTSVNATGVTAHVDALIYVLKQPS